MVEKEVDLTFVEARVENLNSIERIVDPDLNRNAIDYRDNHKYRDAITINKEMQRK